jgi:hypothetical protein
MKTSLSLAKAAKQRILNLNLGVAVGLSGNQTAGFTVEVRSQDVSLSKADLQTIHRAVHPVPLSFKETEMATPRTKTAVIKPCQAKDKDPNRAASEQKICLYTKDGKRLLGRHPSKEAARKQEIAIKMHGGAIVKKTAATLEPVSPAGVTTWLEWIDNDDVLKDVTEAIEEGDSLREIAELAEEDTEAMYPLYEDSTPMHDEDPLAIYIDVGDMYVGTIAEVDGALYFTTYADLREHFEEEGTMYPEGRSAATKKTAAQKRRAKTAALKQLLNAGFVPPSIKKGGKTWLPDLSDPTTKAAWEKSQARFGKAAVKKTASRLTEVALFDSRVLDHLNYTDAYEGEFDSLELEILEVLPAGASDEEFWAVGEEYDLPGMYADSDEDDLAAALDTKITYPVLLQQTELPSGQYGFVAREDGSVALMFSAEGDEEMDALREHLAPGYMEERYGPMEASAAKRLSFIRGRIGRRLKNRGSLRCARGRIRLAYESTLDQFIQFEVLERNVDETFSGEDASTVVPYVEDALKKNPDLVADIQHLKGMLDRDPELAEDLEWCNWTVKSLAQEVLDRWHEFDGHGEPDWEVVNKAQAKWESAYYDKVQGALEKAGVPEDKQDSILEDATGDTGTYAAYMQDVGHGVGIYDYKDEAFYWMDEFGIKEDDILPGADDLEMAMYDAAYSAILERTDTIIEKLLEDCLEEVEEPTEARVKNPKRRIGRKLRRQRRAQGEFTPDPDTIYEMIDKWTWEDVTSFMGDRFSREDDFYSLRQEGDFDEDAYEAWLEENWDALANSRATEDYFEQQVSEVKPKIDEWLAAFGKKVDEVASKLEPEQRERLYEILNKDPAKSTWLVFMAEAGHGIGLSDDYDLEEEAGIDEDDLFPTGDNEANEELSMIPYYVGGWIINNAFDDWQETMAEEE